MYTKFRPGDIIIPKDRNVLVVMDKTDTFFWLGPANLHITEYTFKVPEDSIIIANTSVMLEVAAR